MEEKKSFYSYSIELTKAIEGRSAINPIINDFLRTFYIDGRIQVRNIEKSVISLEEYDQHENAIEIESKDIVDEINLSRDLLLRSLSHNFVSPRQKTGNYYKKTKVPMTINEIQKVKQIEKDKYKQFRMNLVKKPIRKEDLLENAKVASKFYEETKKRLPTEEPDPEIIKKGMEEIKFERRKEMGKRITSYNKTNISQQQKQLVSKPSEKPPPPRNTVIMDWDKKVESEIRSFLTLQSLVSQNLEEEELPFQSSFETLNQIIEERQTEKPDNEYHLKFALLLQQIQDIECHISQLYKEVMT